MTVAAGLIGTDAGSNSSAMSAQIVVKRPWLDAKACLHQWLKGVSRG